MKKVALLLSVIAIACGTPRSAQNDSVSSYKNARDWYNSRAWLQGANFSPNIPLDVDEFARQYAANPTYWRQVFSYLKNTDLRNLKPGKYPIDGDNVYASVTNDATKDYEKTNWESHRIYIDVQCVVEGEEKIGVMPVEGATVTRPYNEEKDVANYTGEAPLYTGKAGTFFIFFPGTAHRPNITTGGNKVEKKVVIKVRSAS